MSIMTPNFGLMMPELTDSPPDITATNPNWEKIDNELYRYYTNTSATDAYEITINGIDTYSNLLGIPILVKMTVANTDNCTLNVNGLGAVNIVRGTGTNLLTGDITAGKIVELVYDGVNFQLISQGVDVSQASKSETLANKTLTAPRFASAGYMADANGNELIKFPSTVASAVNELTLANAAAGFAPSISTTGGDTNVSLNLITKGTGTVQVNGKAVATKSSTVSANLVASSWSGTAVPYTYTAAVAGVTATSNQDLSPNPSITQVQLSALQAANVLGYSQAANSITLRAWGTRPVVDIPVVFTIRGDA